MVEKEGSARGSVHWGCYYATALDIEVDPAAPLPTGSGDGEPFSNASDNCTKATNRDNAPGYDVRCAFVCVRVFPIQPAQFIFAYTECFKQTCAYCLHTNPKP